MTRRLYPPTAVPGVRARRAGPQLRATEVARRETSVQDLDDEETSVFVQLTALPSRAHQAPAESSLDAAATLPQARKDVTPAPLASGWDALALARLSASSTRARAVPLTPLQARALAPAPAAASTSAPAREHAPPTAASGARRAPPALPHIMSPEAPAPELRHDDRSATVQRHRTERPVARPASDLTPPSAAARPEPRLQPYREAAPQEKQGWTTQLAPQLLYLLRFYAGIFCASSPALGACVLIGSFASPRGGAMALLAVASALVTARVLGLVSQETPATLFAYAPLFIGLGAGHTFADPIAAIALATLGSMTVVLITAAMGGVSKRIGLPALSMPFLIVFFCAISAGKALGASWLPPEHNPGLLAGMLPGPASWFFEALGAIVFQPRSDLGLLIFVGLCLTRTPAPLLGILGFATALGVEHLLQLQPLGLRFGAAINATLTAIGIGSWYGISRDALLRAVLGALLCVAFSFGLADSLDRLGLIPVSLPFNLAIWTLLLIDRQRTTDVSTGTGSSPMHATSAPRKETV